jgi:DNA repair protein RecN (Recombination protein N)
VDAAGRTRAYVNQRPVAREALAELAGQLLEIHGQNDHQRLLDPSEQLRLLDEYGKLTEPLRAYRTARASWRECHARVVRIEGRAQERKRRLDSARGELAELRDLAPSSDEIQELLSERELLRHAAGLRGVLERAAGELAESDGALLERAAATLRELGEWNRRVSRLGRPVEALQTAVDGLADSARELRSLAESTEADPERLERIEARLAELERLARKHACGMEGLASLAENLRAEVAELEDEEHDSAGLLGRQSKLRADLLQSAAALRAARLALRSELVRAVQAVLAELGLDRARFDVRWFGRESRGEPAAGPGATLAPLELAAADHDDEALFGERGCERVEFLVSTNPGQPLLPLRQVASGGEMARIMLALRSVMAVGVSERTLVFDEIDANVGGRLGPVVARRLQALGKRHQVLCVTHLPAIAAAAERHMRVSKSSTAQRTQAQVDLLSGRARVSEIADMIAGGGDQATAQAEARRLMELAGRGEQAR